MWQVATILDSTVLDPSHSDISQPFQLSSTTPFNAPAKLECIGYVLILIVFPRPGLGSCYSSLVFGILQRWHIWCCSNEACLILSVLE